MVALEFTIFLGYDGQLEQNSDMEKELFTSAIDQLKERFYIIILIQLCLVTLRYRPIPIETAQNQTPRFLSNSDDSETQQILFADFIQF